MDVVGNHEQMARLGEPARLLLRARRKLIKRVEGQELDPGAGVDFFAAETGAQPSHYSVCAFVAVADGLAYAPPIRV